MKIQILYIPECSNYEPTLHDIEQILAEAEIEAEIEVVEVRTERDARRLEFPGSPTIRIDGMDIEPLRVFSESDFVLRCRLYIEYGQIRPWPSKRVLEDSIEIAHLVLSGIFHGCC